MASYANLSYSNPGKRFFSSGYRKLVPETRGVFISNIQCIYILVGGFNPSEKYEFVSWDDDIPIYEMENKKCSKPPTRYIQIYNVYYIEREIQRLTSRNQLGFRVNGRTDPNPHRPFLNLSPSSREGMTCWELKMRVFLNSPMEAKKHIISNLKSCLYIPFAGIQPKKRSSPLDIILNTCASTSSLVCPVFQYLMICW